MQYRHEYEVISHNRFKPKCAFLPKITYSNIVQVKTHIDGLRLLFPMAYENNMIKVTILFTTADFWPLPITIEVVSKKDKFEVWYKKLELACELYEADKLEKEEYMLMNADSHKKTEKLLKNTVKQGFKECR